MKIIISPAKKMNCNTDEIAYKALPTFLEQANTLREYLKSLPLLELKELFACNEKIAELNYDRYQHMKLEQGLTPALLAYEGIQYQYMAPQVFTDSQWEYVEKNLRILSGFYGILRPLDGVVPYRLEMQAKLKSDFCSNLYEFWSDKLYRELVVDDNIILNLASKEYSKAIEPYLNENTNFITCIFGTLVEGKLKVKATEAKMARGEMVRYLAAENVNDIESIKKFHGLEFEYSEEYSGEKELVFIKGSH